MKENRFLTSLIGSWPRSEKLLKLKKQLKRNESVMDEYNNLLVSETGKIIKLQEDLNLDYIVSGELERDNFVSFVGEKIKGVKILNMSEMLEYIEDKFAFEQILNTLDVPSLSIKNAICFDKLELDESLCAKEVELIKQFSDKPIKITLPGPYLMTRSMWLPKLSKNYYSSKEELGKDVVEILKSEIDTLDKLGVQIIQFDEPVLTEVVFTPDKTRTFMCSALSEKQDPKDELKFAANLIKQVMDYAKTKNSKVALHVCRGNWSKDESTLLSGSYGPLIELFKEVNPDILNLEFSTPRAGEIDVLFNNLDMKNTILGLGVINPRTDDIELITEIVSFVDETLKFTTPENLWLNPDCGFATFANRPVGVENIIVEKIKALTTSARIMKEKR
ncbi:cobalamin-independent methionine synthase [Spiroplasma chinense]|uniref:Cobalamin-independent methionine synthase n=1 Tax=Spiroplasma chinense TaxID=216932 RepID=A0A5B9Y432_9MOLU|nr:cobalamin-independent methionine synthase II family protein [Spiroplasma chinense]QEH61523.1 cobalamin-independent methionine synthase [Spiroplasma chinense]